MSLSRVFPALKTVPCPTPALVAAMALLALSGCAGLFGPNEAPPVEVAAPEPPKPAPTPGPHEVWLSISDQEAMERLRRSIESGQLKMKLATQASAPNILETRTQPKTGAYLDCGTVQITTIRNKRVTVPAAKSFQQFRQRINGIDYSVWRSMHLGVTTRLEVKPRPDAAGASVRYQPTYLVTRERLVTGGGKQPMVFRDTVQFGPDENRAFANAASPCRSNGRLERELREMLVQLESLVPESATQQQAKPVGAAAKKHKPVSLPARLPAKPSAKTKDIVAARGNTR